MASSSAVWAPRRGWRWIFFVNIPIGIAAVLLLAAAAAGAAPGEGARGHDLDLVGVALLGAGVLAILFPLVQEQQWKGTRKWALLAFGWCSWSGSCCGSAATPPAAASRWWT